MIVFFFIFTFYHTSLKAESEVFSTYLKKCQKYHQHIDSLLHYGGLLMALETSEAKFEGAYALSYAYQHTGNFDTALYFLEKARKNLAPDDRRHLRIWRMRSINQSKSGDWRQALNSTDSLLVLSELWQDSLHSNIAYNTKGIIYRQQGQLNKALKAYHQSLKIAAHINDPQMANLHTNIAILYQDLGFSKTALEWFQKAHYIAKKQPESPLLIRTTLNLGNHFKILHQLDSAEYYFGILAQVPHQNTHQRSLLLQNYADLFILKEDTATAKIYLDSLFALIKDTEDIQKKVEYYNVSTRWHRLQNQDHLTLAYLDSSIYLSRKHQLMSKLLNLYYDKALLLEKQEKFRASLEMLKAFAHLEDSLDKASDLTIMRDIISDIELKNKKNMLSQKAGAATQSSSLPYLFYIALILPILLFWLWKNRKKQLHPAPLSKNPIKISTPNEEKDAEVSKEETKENHASNTFPILLKSKNVVLPEEILFIKSKGHYLYIHTAADENPMMERNSLKNFQNQLHPEKFIRIHRSYIVNTKYIKTISSQEIILNNEAILPLSRVHKQQLKSAGHPLFS